MQFGTVDVVCMASIFSLIQGISVSLLSLTFCLESQSATIQSSPDLYMILILHWCNLSRIRYSLFDSVATSFLNIAISDS